MMILNKAILLLTEPIVMKAEDAPITNCLIYGNGSWPVGLVRTLREMENSLIDDYLALLRPDLVKAETDLRTKIYLAKQAAQEAQEELDSLLRRSP